jgi:hypothetical protein
MEMEKVVQLVLLEYIYLIMNSYHLLLVSNLIVSENKQNQHTMAPLCAKSADRLQKGSTCTKSTQRLWTLVFQKQSSHNDKGG